MMKKKTALLLVALLLVQVFSCYAYAAPIDGEIMQPYYIAVRTCGAGLTLMNATTGYTKCVGTITLRDGYTADMTMRLVQVNDEGLETDIATWYLNDTEYPAMQYYRYLESDYNYYLRVDGYIYDTDGNYIEHVYVTDTLEY